MTSPTNRDLRWTRSAWDEYVYWQGQDRRTLKRIDTLVQACLRDPFDGPGKPEPLRGSLAGYWSRRIDRQHRLVYRVDEDAICVVQCRFHYQRS